MTRYDQKQIERIYLENFLKDTLHKGQIENDESPDFNFITDNGTKIGIEIREVFHPNITTSKYSPQQNASQFDLIIKMTRKQYEKKSKTPLHVIFTFNDQINGNRKVLKNLANTLADLIHKNVNIQDYSTQYTSIIKRDSLPNEISSISILYYPYIFSSVWSGGLPQFLPKLSITHLQNIIDEKEKKIPFYKQNYKILWLVLVIDNGLRTTSFTDNSDINNHQFQSTFENIYLYKYIERKVIKLAIF